MREDTCRGENVCSIFEEALVFDVNKFRYLGEVEDNLTYEGLNYSAPRYN